MPVLPHDALMLLALLTVQQVPLPCRYVIRTYYVVGDLALGCLFVLSVVFWVPLALALLMDPTLDLECVLKESCYCLFNVMLFCSYTPS